MYFAHDPQQDFYYLGEQKPRSGFYREQLINQTPRLIGVDVETISLKERIAIGISIAVEPKLCFYFPLFPNPSYLVAKGLGQERKVWLSAL